MIQKIAIFFASLFGIGWIYGAPTIVSALLIAIVLKYKELYKEFLPSTFSTSTVAIFFSIFVVLGVLISLVDEKYYNKVVADRIIGVLALFIFVPINYKVALVGFTVYRFFDIIKPWPLYLFTNGLFKGFGNVIDDLLAGILTSAILYIILILYHNLMLYL